MYFTIDIGTTAVKMALYDQERVTFTYQEAVETHFEEHGVAYQHPEEIKAIILRGLMQSKQQQVTFEQVILSTPMHTLIPLQTDPLRMYIWSDQQASVTAKELKQTEFAKTCYQKTGTPIHPMSPFCKLASFKSEKENWYESIHYWGDLKAYLMDWLTGQWVTDYSNASASGLMNSELFCWDCNILSYLDLDQTQLPKLADTTIQFRPLPTIEEKIGHEFTIMIGASDGCLASLAGKISTKSSVSITLGTSGAVRVLTKKRTLDPLGRFFCYYLTKDQWVIGGPTNNGGKVLEWIGKVFYDSKEQLYAQLPEVLAQTTPGARGVLFYPYLFGERAPLWSGDITAAYQGIRWEHERMDLIRAAIEGVLFNLSFIKQLLIHETPLLSVSGGFFQQPALLELSAAIFQTPICYSEQNEPTFGAYLLANRSIEQVELPEIHPVNQKLSATYQTAYTLFSSGLTKISEQI